LNKGIKISHTIRTDALYPATKGRPWLCPCRTPIYNYNKILMNSGIVMTTSFKARFAHKWYIGAFIQRRPGNNKERCW